MNLQRHTSHGGERDIWSQAGPKTPETTLLQASLGAELARGELRQDLNTEEPGRMLVMLAKNVIIFL